MKEDKAYVVECSADEYIEHLLTRINRLDRELQIVLDQRDNVCEWFDNLLEDVKNGCADHEEWDAASEFYTPGELGPKQ